MRGDKCHPGRGKRVKIHHLFKNHLKSGQKCLDFKWSGFQMVETIALAIAKARPFEIQPSKCPDFKWSDFRSPKYLNACPIFKWTTDCLIFRSWSEYWVFKSVIQTNITGQNSDIQMLFTLTFTFDPNNGLLKARCFYVGYSDPHCSLA